MLAGFGYAYRVVLLRGFAVDCGFCVSCMGGVIPKRCFVCFGVVLVFGFVVFGFVRIVFLWFAVTLVVLLFWCFGFWLIWWLPLVWYFVVCWLVLWFC